jgi:hypothetical protein
MSDRIIAMSREWRFRAVLMVVVGALVMFEGAAALAGTAGIPFCGTCVSKTIAPELLVVRTHDLPGFAGAKTSLEATESASVWAHGGESTPAEAEAEVAYLRREGFQEAVQETVRSPHNREAQSFALVFKSAYAGKRELSSTYAADLKGFNKRGLKRLAVRTIAGAKGLSTFVRGQHFASGNVLFTTGRCFFVVVDYVHNAVTRAQGDRAPLVAAKVLYKRTKPLCRARNGGAAQPAGHDLHVL